MRRNCLVVFGVVLVIGCVFVASEAVAGSEEDVAAIDKVREMEAASVNDASSANVAKIYAADVEYLPPGEPALKGVDAIAEWHSSLIGQMDVDLKYTASEVKVLGDWAIEQYAGTVVLTPKAGGDAISENVRGIHVYHRGADGSWKITHDIWNTDKPATATE